MAVVGSVDSFTIALAITLVLNRVPVAIRRVSSWLFMCCKTCKHASATIAKIFTSAYRWVHKIHIVYKRCNIFELTHIKTNKMACASSENSDQPGYPPSLIRVSAVRMKKAWLLSYPLSTKQRLWSDGANAQADLRLRWAQSHFIGFVMRWLMSVCRWVHKIHMLYAQKETSATHLLPIL